MMQLFQGMETIDRQSSSRQSSSRQAADQVSDQASRETEAPREASEPSSRRVLKKVAWFLLAIAVFAVGAAGAQHALALYL
ncbi:MAG TPA: hypothetical protein VF989_07015, partial [Polyangiaceae bacterium]